MKRALGLDVGDKTIGIAISDPFFMMAQGLTTIRRTTIEKDLQRLYEIVEEKDIDTIVIGLPKNMNNTIGPQGEKVMEFYDLLQAKLPIKIILQDERLTTVSAEKMLIKQNVRRSRRKVVIDMVAATFILQGYLDGKRSSDANH